MSSFKIGTVCGPYRNNETFLAPNGSVTFLVKGEGAWVQFSRPEKWKGEAEEACRAAARRFAAKLLAPKTFPRQRAGSMHNQRGKEGHHGQQLTTNGSR
jgi:hypothetical protein